MADPSVFDFLRIPPGALIALDNRPLHFALQPWHYLIRIGHIVSMSLFFGGIALLDLKLMGAARALSLRDTASWVLPTVYWTFGIAFVTGVLLFLYDPVHVGSHAYFGPKLLAVVLGLANAALFNRSAFASAMESGGNPALSTRIAGFLSLAFWASAVVFASLNVEAAPRVLLTR